MGIKRKKDYFKETLKDYLTFSRNERRGLFAVILILLILIISKRVIEHRSQAIPPADHAGLDKEMNNLIASSKTDSAAAVKPVHAYVHEKTGFTTKPEKGPSELFNFNPNGLPVEDWERLGLSEKQALVIKHYEEKGGKFYAKDDVKKMYTISPEEYQRIEPYIVIPPRENIHYENKFPSKASYNDVKVDIGVADTTELKKLRGIGTSYANRIAKYRAKLGGFHSVNQLHEVWGLDDSLFNVIAGHVYITDSNSLSKININTATFNDLKSHPYFNYNLSNALINYRIQHGAFKDVADIRRISLVDDSIYRKIAPYLKIE